MGWLPDLRNPGDTLGDRRRGVGYGAVAFEPLFVRRRLVPCRAVQRGADGAGPAGGSVPSAAGGGIDRRDITSATCGLSLAPLREAGK